MFNLVRLFAAISGIGLQWLPNSVLEEKGKKISLILSKKFKKSFLSTNVGRNGEKKTGHNLQQCTAKIGYGKLEPSKQQSHIRNKSFGKRKKKKLPIVYLRNFTSTASSH